MTEKTATFTGHRTIQNVDLPRLTERLEKTIADLISQGVVRFLSGGATGFDTMAATAVLAARNQHQAVKLCMVLPCSNQDERWKTADRLTYRHLLEIADEVFYVSEKPYFDGCMEQRNRYLIQNSSVCVAYMRRGRSGTSQTVRFAREHGLTVINLAEE